jgi:TetR/AcrR family transcriptional regulator, cholesterol catabolism regulator
MTEAIRDAGDGAAGRRARRSDVSRQQILDVAAKPFRAHGYTETSLRDIGKQAGVKAGSLYYHFTSKD